MTVEELIVYGKKYLHSFDVNCILSNLMNYDVLELSLHLNEKVNKKVEEKFMECIEKAKNNVPVQYIIGNVNFFGNKFIVNENVLIPRFETEELVERVISFVKEKFNDANKIIDLGCGSGVIGITLAKKIPNVEVTCLDISYKALEVAKKNAEINCAKIKFVQGDMLSNVYDKFDIIVSNPPYIADNEIIEEIVKNNEPSIALYGGKDGLLYYENILSTASEKLNDKYLIAFEIGYNQKDKIIDIAKKYFKDSKIECYKDMSSKDRIIFIYNV